MTQASVNIAQQFQAGGVIPADLVGQSAVSKKYVDDQLAIRDANISAVAGAASAAQADIDAHESSPTAHPSQNITYSGAVTGVTNVKQALDKVNSDIITNKANAESNLEAHKNSTTAHMAQHIPYSGSVIGAENAKQALDNLKQTIDNLILGSGDSGPEVAAARGDFPTLGDRLDATDERFAETKMYNGKKYTIHNPYKDGGKLALKGQLHCHTTNSDGAQSPFDVVTAYKNAGYEFIAITDHNYITPDPGVPGITFIQSVEETSAAHIVAYDVTELAGLTSAQDTINFEVARGKLCSIAHPNWSVYLIDKLELVGYYDYNFTEIYSSLISHYTGPAEDKVDAVLTSGKRLFYIASDDCHNINDVFNKGWVVVYCSENTKADILSNLRKGNFYASTGNDIAISVADNVITASSTSASTIHFIGEGGKVLQTNNGVTSASYTIKGDEMYIRVRSTKASDGTIAWAQPIFLETVGGDERHKLNYTRNSNLHGVKRQAIINGGFTVNQRGSDSGTVTGGAPAGYLVDGWFNNLISATVFPPSVTVYRRELTWPDTNYGRYCLGISWSGPESGPYTGTAEYGVFQRIENGTRLLCGGNKKITLSFYARATTGPKKIGIVIKQRYGTGGSPSGSDDMLAGVVDLVTTFKKYELTIETKTLEGKTFGTNGDDYLQVGISCMWHDTAIYGSNEHFGPANGVEIAQVQLNSGDMALPYCERHISDELRLCQRYLRVGTIANQLFMADGNQLGIQADFVGMRTVPSVRTIGTWYLHESSDTTPIAIPDGTTFDTQIGYNGAAANLPGLGITSGKLYQINGSSPINDRIGGPAKYLASAEL